MPETAERSCDSLSIHPFDSLHSIGDLLHSIDGSTPSSTAWVTANRGIFIPFRIANPWPVRQAVVGCGSTAGNNFDVGVYDHLGNRLVSSGSTARTSGAEAIVNLTDTWLLPGRYYMALVSDSISTFLASTPSQTAGPALLRLGGIKESPAVFPLPDPVTLFSITVAYIPIFSLWRTAI